MNTNKHVFQETGNLQAWTAPPKWQPEYWRTSATKAAGLTRLFFFFVQPGFDRGLNFFVELLVVLQNFFRGVAALRQLGALVAEPGTAFFDDLFLQCKIEQRAS